MTAPAFDDHLGFFEGVKDFSVESFVPQFAVERFAVAVLPGTTRRDVNCLGTQPFQGIVRLTGLDM